SDKSALMGDSGSGGDSAAASGSGEHTAKALGYAVVKYESLKNNILTNFTISSDK
nr:hypothetical protein [Tanacetum cinerariifolium]